MLPKSDPPTVFCEKTETCGVPLKKFGFPRSMYKFKKEERTERARRVKATVLQLQQARKFQQGMNKAKKACQKRTPRHNRRWQRDELYLIRALRSATSIQTR